MVVYLTRGFYLTAYLLLSLFATNSALAAQPDGDKRVAGPPVLVTAEQLIDKIKESNPSFLAAIQEQKSRELELAPNAVPADPKLSLALENYPSESFEANRYGMTGNTISLTQEIPFPGKLAAIQRATEAGILTARAETTQKQAELVKSALELFIRLHFIDKRLALNAEERRILGGMLTVGDSRLSVGGDLIDAVDPRIELSDAELSHLAFESERNDQEAKINAMIGNDSLPHGWQTSFKVPSKLEGVLLDQTRALEAACNSDPELASIKAQITGAERSQVVANYNYYPDFEVTAGYTIRSPNRDDGGEDFVSAGVAVNIPIWSSAKQDKISNLAKNNAELWRTRAAERKNNLYGEIRSLYAAVDAATKSSSLIANSILPQIDAVYASSRTAYETGRGQLPSLLRLIRMKFEQQNKLFEHQAARELAIIQLKYLTGGLL